MPINNDSFFKYQEARAQSGYKTALLIEDETTHKYSLLIASETVPSVFGETESFEFDLLNMPTKGKIQGKQTLDDKDVEFLYHRDNIYRLSKLVGNPHNFITLTPDFVAHKFVGTISMRMNDASNDVLKGTYTITAQSASKPILDGRGLDILETLCFANAIPENVTSQDKLNLAVVQRGATITVKAKEISGEDNSEGTETTLTAGSDGLYALSTLVAASGSTGLYAITASATGYAPWTTTVYITYQASA